MFIESHCTNDDDSYLITITSYGDIMSCFDIEDFQWLDSMNMSFPSMTRQCEFIDKYHVLTCHGKEGFVISNIYGEMKVTFGGIQVDAFQIFHDSCFIASMGRKYVQFVRFEQSDKEFEVWTLNQKKRKRKLSTKTHIKKRKK